MFDLRVVSGNTSLKMGHRQSVYKITTLTGIDGIPVSVVTSQGFEQVGESVDSMSVGSRQIGLIGRIDNFTGEQLQALNTAFLPMTTVRLYFEEKYWIDAVIKEAPVFTYSLRTVLFAVQLLGAVSVLEERQRALLQTRRIDRRIQFSGILRYAAQF